MQLESTFGVEYSESLGAAKTLMTNFGLSADEAFDFIASGFQDGLNGSDDFLDSINEYATQFSNGGADAGQFFSVLSSGFQEGMLGTDKAADAFKEFRVRIEDGSTTTSEALAQIGLGEEFTTSLANGEITAIQAFGTVIERLGAVEDSSVQMQAGVGLLGTQYEDLGTAAALSLSTTRTKMEDIVGTMDDFDTTTFSQKMTSAWRTAVDSVADMNIWDGLKGQAGDAMVAIAENFESVFENYDFSGLEDSAGELWDTIAGHFEDADLDLTTMEGMQNAIDLVVGSIESLMNVTGGIVDIFAPLVSGVISVIDTFNSLDDDTQKLVGNITGIGTALGTVGTVLATGGSVISGIVSLTGLVSSGGALATGVGALIALLTGPVGLAVGLAAVGTAVVGFSLSEMSDEAEQAKLAIEAETQTIKDLTDQIDALPTTVPTVDIFVALEAGDYEETQKLIDDAAAKAHEIQVKAEVEQQEFTDFYNELVKVGNVTQVEIEAMLNAGSLTEAKAALEGIAQDRKAGLIFEIEGGDALSNLSKEISSISDTYKFDVTADVEYGQLVEFQTALSRAAEDSGIDITTTVDSTDFDTLRQTLIDSNDLTEFELKIVKNAQSFSDLTSSINEFLYERVAEIRVELDSESFDHEISNISEMNNVQVTAAVEYSQLNDFKQLLSSAVENSEIDINASVNDTEFEQFKQDLMDSSSLTELEISMVQDATSVGELEAAIDTLIEDRKVVVKAEPDFEGATETIDVWTEEHGTISIEVPVDTSGVEKAKKEIDSVPTEKQIEIKLQGEIDKELAQIEANAATVQTAVEWQAKLDIAEVEAATAQIESAYNTIATTIESSGEVITSALDTLASGDIDLQTKWAALELLEDESDYRAESLKMQKELNEAQVAYLKARTDALSSGEIAINVKSDGLQPHLRSLWFEVLKDLQVQMNEESADFLLAIA